MFINLNILASMLLGYSWWRDRHREAFFEGEHLRLVVKGLKMGIIIFIASEVFFFISFFWSFLHSRISPSIELGEIWPPLGLEVLDPMGVPLMNTVLLLSSGISVTWCHHALLNQKMFEAKKSLLLTIWLGIVFSLVQVLEYINVSFSLRDSVFGSTFFIMTGFHGLHVIIGSIFLLVTLFRINFFRFSSSHLLGFEISAWYWHFVDVVWLFLYCLVYWWRM